MSPGAVVVVAPVASTKRAITWPHTISRHGRRAATTDDESHLRWKVHPTSFIRPERGVNAPSELRSCLSWSHTPASENFGRVSFATLHFCLANTRTTSSPAGPLRRARSQMADYDAANITDSTDWLGTPLPGLSPVESALRCRVCRDFYKTPMLTTCLHTFCSLCIRRSLANDGRCPACRAPEQESKLRWNGSLDEAVDAYVKARPTVLSFARDGPQGSRHSPKRKLEHETSPDSSENASRKRLRSSARLSRARGEEATAEMVRQEVEVIEDSADEEYEENRMYPFPRHPNSTIHIC